jgi:hypothetical protein
MGDCACLGAYCALTGLCGVESLVTAMKRLVPPYRTQHVIGTESALRAGAGTVEAMAAPVSAGSAKTSPEGRYPGTHGYPVPLADILAILPGTSYVARGAVNNAGGICTWPLRICTASPVRWVFPFPVSTPGS